MLRRHIICKAFRIPNTVDMSYERLTCSRGRSNKIGELRICWSENMCHVMCHVTYM